MKVARLLLMGLAAWLGLAAPAWSQTCGQDYVVQEGDSLAKIATRAYGKSSQWTIIFYANQDRLGGGSSLLVPGLAIRIPCPGGGAAALPQEATSEATSEPTGGESKAIVLSDQVKRIEFLTADDYAPFTDRSLPSGGMATEIVSASMELLKKEAGAGLDYKVSWVNDWSAHLNPLLVTRAFDMGFPWYKPSCQHFADLDTDAKFRCQKFFFSNPIFEEQVLFFVKADSPITFQADAEINGKKLCRPTGYWTFDLDDNGRNWVKDNKVVLMRPPSVDECFRLLLDGSVDAVALNELTGRASVARLDLAAKVRVIDRPIAILSLHVLVAKAHPNARTLLYYVNSSLDKLKAAGEYDKIVEKHLTQFWESQTEQAPAAATSSTETTDTAAAAAAANATESTSAAATSNP